MVTDADRSSARRSLSLRPLLLACMALVGCGSSGDGPSGHDSGSPVDAGRATDGGGCSTVEDAAARVPPDSGPQEAPPVLDCGVPTFREGTGMVRRPYLQSATQTSVRIAWTSTSGGRGLLRYAPSPEGPWTELEAAVETFDTDRTGQPMDYQAYDVTLTDLAEGQAYCYQVLEGDQVLASGLRFETAWTGSARPLRLLAFGDSGDGSPTQYAVRDAFMRHDFDIFLHLGDMAYDDGTFPELEERYFGVYRDLMHAVPTFPAMGNHEHNTDRGQPYLDVHYLPEVALTPEDQERYYSFDYGNVHFVVLDSNDRILIPILLGLTEDSMVEWLVDDLASSDADFKIALFHHAPYTAQRGLNSSVHEVLVPLLEAGGVDLVLAGHDHHYERTVPMWGGCAAAGRTDAPVYVVAGGGGAGLRDTTPAFWTTAVEDDVHTFLRMEIHGCVAHGIAEDVDGNTVDEFWLNACD